MSATPGPSVRDIRGRAWRSVRFVVVGAGLAIALHVFLTRLNAGLDTEDGPIAILLVGLPVALAGLIEWQFDRRGQAKAAHPSPPAP